MFAVNISGAGFTNVHNFASGDYLFSNVYSNSDGAWPQGSLIMSGNILYGTTSTGGTNGDGTLFAVHTDGTGFRNLYTFPAVNGDDGPYAGLILSGNTLYGTTEGGGYGDGTVFAVNTDGTDFTNLYILGVNGDGAEPFAGLVSSGNTLYGTTYYGGSAGNGTVFRINTDGSDFTNLYVFSALDPQHNTNTDGAHPNSGLTLSDNDLYGTTSSGGTNADGTVFAIHADGSFYTILHTFSAVDQIYFTNSDGAEPHTSLTLSGNTLFGTTSFGGTEGYGTVFNVSAGILSNSFLPIGPVIIAQPQSQTVLASQTASFSVLVSGSPVPTLKWHKNGIAINGASGSLLTLTNVQLSDQARYNVVASNNVDVLTSASASLVIIPTSTVAPPILNAPVARLSNGSFQFVISGIIGNTCTIQSSSNLVNWDSIFTTNVSLSSFAFNITNSILTDGAMFFRVVESGQPSTIVESGSSISFAADTFNVDVTNGSATISVTRNGIVSNTVCVDYATTGGTAIAGLDYTPVAGTICFPPDVTSNSFSIPILTAGTNGQDVTIDVQLRNAGDNVALNTVLNIHKPKPVVSIQPAHLALVVPDNCVETLTIGNVGPAGSILNFTVFDSGGLLDVSLTGPETNIDHVFLSGSLTAGQYADIDIAVLPRLVNSFGPYDLNPQLGWPIISTPLIVDTPNAANYIRFPVWVDIFSEEGAANTSEPTCLDFQDYTVYIIGHVYHASCDGLDFFPLAGATITTSLGGLAMSDVNGYFVLIVPTGGFPPDLEYSISVTSPDYPDQDAGFSAVFGRTPPPQSFVFQPDCP